MKVTISAITKENKKENFNIYGDSSYSMHLESDGLAVPMIIEDYEISVFLNAFGAVVEDLGNFETDEEVNFDNGWVSEGTIELLHTAARAAIKVEKGENPEAVNAAAELLLSYFNTIKGITFDVIREEKLFTEACGYDRAESLARRIRRRYVENVVQCSEEEKPLPTPEGFLTANAYPSENDTEEDIITVHESILFGVNAVMNEMLPESRALYSGTKKEAELFGFICGRFEDAFHLVGMADLFNLAIATREKHLPII